MDNDKIITARIEDELEQCERGSYITATGFLNMHEQSLAMRIVRGRSDVKSFICLCNDITIWDIRLDVVYRRAIE